MEPQVCTTDSTNQLTLIEQVCLHMAAPLSNVCCDADASIQRELQMACPCYTLQLKTQMVNVCKDADSESMLFCPW